MWGPANALLDENISGDQQGLTPRVFEHLFARINEVSISCLSVEHQILRHIFTASFLWISQEQIKNADKQLKYQCHCSLLEVDFPNLSVLV